MNADGYAHVYAFSPRFPRALAEAVEVSGDDAYGEEFVVEDLEAVD